MKQDGWRMALVSRRLNRTRDGHAGRHRFIAAIHNNDRTVTREASLLLAPSPRRVLLLGFPRAPSRRSTDEMRRDN